MESLYDEFSMSLASSVPRRESLRRMGAVLAGAVLGQFGLGTAWAAGQDACKSFCRCSNRAQQNQCLQACRACRGETGRLVGSCGSYVCCSTAACNGVCSDLRADPNCGACGNDCGDLGETCCGTYCADLANDFDNCGGCGVRCDNPTPYEVGECFDGACVYACAPGAMVCDGICTPVISDPNNCGACGNQCTEPTPFCSGVICTDADCGGVDLLFNSSNCGTCGNVCPWQTYCVWGVCTGGGDGDGYGGD